MPFVAYEKESEKRIKIREWDNPRKELKDVLFSCQDCVEDLYIRQGAVVKPYFAHYPNKDRKCSYFDDGGESKEHRAAVLSIIKLLSGDSLYDGCQFEDEVFFTIEETGKKRRVDMLVKFPDGQLEAHEIQLSKISAYGNNGLEERTSDYKKLGIDLVVWWLGKNANTEENKRWQEGNSDYVATLSSGVRHIPKDFTERNNP